MSADEFFGEIELTLLLINKALKSLPSRIRTSRPDCTVFEPGPSMEVDPSPAARDLKQNSVDIPTGYRLVIIISAH